MDFAQLALLMGVAAAAGVVAKLLKQPLLIGYLFAGVLLAGLGLVSDTHALEELGHVGVALLLFSVGIEMNIKDIPSIGKVALITGLGQMTFTSLIGFALVKMLGFGNLSAFYIAFALTFSSTIIAVKMLSEKSELQSLYGKITLGFLLVQDLVAVVLLIAMAGVSSGDVSIYTYLAVVVKAFLLIAFLWLLSRKFLHVFFEKYIDSSSELIFIVSIAWALGMSAVVGGPLGLSLEIGGFLAGIALSNMPEHLQIAAKTRPIRDFFLTIFFLVLGTNLIVPNFAELIIPGILLSLFVIIGNPLIQLTILGALGFRKKTNFSSSVAIAQVSEFSLILMSAALAIGHVSESDVALVVFIAVLTMTISTYLIMKTEWLFEKFKNALSIFERKKVVREAPISENYLKDHIVLVGADRTGKVLIPTLKKKSSFVVVDFNPKVVSKLTSKGIPAVFGDITDEEVQEGVSLSKAKSVISTTFSLADNLILLRSINSYRRKPKFIAKARKFSDAFKLYKEGATYVLVPEVLAGEHIRHLIKTYGVNRLEKLGISHHKRLKKIYN